MPSGRDLPPGEGNFLDSAACGLLQTDHAGLILRVNQPFCDWVGYSREDLVGKRKLQELFTMGGRIFHQTHAIPLLQLQGSISEVKLEVIHSAGYSIPMVLNTIQRKQAGSIVHDVAAFVARDRDKYERELVHSRKQQQLQLDESNRLRMLAEQMVGIVSHDLRTPLSVIKMGAALLSRANKEPELTKVIERIDRSSTRATRMIADLLDFTQTRLGSGLSVAIMPGDLHRAIAECVEELRQANPEHVLAHQPVGDGACAFDADRLAQVVINLVANAVSYGRPDRPITVRSRIDEAHFSFSVHNEGPCIPEAKQAAVFEPMVRGDGHSAVQHGIGLGLYISREIVKAHGGTLSVCSEPVHGTEFAAVIPRKPAR